MKEIYKNRIKTLGKEFKRFKIFTEKTIQKVEEYILLISDIQKEIENISSNIKIEPNKKYIIINEKLEYIEEVSGEISKLKTSIENKKSKIVKSRDVLIESCLNENKNLTEKDIYLEIEKYSN